MDGKLSPDSGIESLEPDVWGSIAGHSSLKMEFDANSAPVDVSEMLAAENELQALNEKNDIEMKQKAEANFPKVQSQDAYAKLQILLEKSNVYADLILARMEQEQQKSLRSKKTSQKTTQEISCASALPRPYEERCLRKRKATTSRAKPGQLSQFFDKNELSSKRGKYLTEDIPTLNTTLSTKNIEFECDLRYFTGGSLRDYQIEGLCWLKTQFEQGINGILADEMGLGKTIQCIALFAHFYAKGVAGPFLVVGPLSTLPNWYSEFRKFAPKLPVVLYHGKKDKRALLGLEIMKHVNLDGVGVKPVILTSYEVLMKDRYRLVKSDPRYLVIDEGHRVKNSSCLLLKALRHFSCSRLLMTGTPLQNNLAELWSLLNFLLPEIFTDRDWFENFFAFQTVKKISALSTDLASLNQEEEERERHILSKLHNILKPFLLRRIKTDVELKLPPKKEIWVYAPMTTKQLQYYKATVEKQILQLCGKCLPTKLSGKRRSNLRPETMLEKADSKENKRIVEQNLSGARNTVMILREICLHPYLLEYPLTDDGEYLVDDQLVKQSGKMLVFDRLVTELISQDHKILVFSQFCMLLNLLHDYCYLRKFKFSRLDGSMSLEERQKSIEKFATEPDVRLFLISTKAGGLGLNLIAADTVIIFDSDWNPQGDLQAQDRCHRIGQLKPVVVYRLICKNTVDERMIETAVKKRNLEKMVIHAGKFQFSRKSSKKSALSKQEFIEVLKSTDYNAIWEIDPESVEGVAGDRVISDKTLGKILDRRQMDAKVDNLDDNNEAFKIAEICDNPIDI